MDRKSILILVACFALLMLWVPLVNVIYPPVPAPLQTNTLGVAGSNLRQTNSHGLIAEHEAEISSAKPGPLTLPESAGPEQIETLETPEALYTFSSHGGGLKTIELKEYPESVNCARRGSAPTNRLATLNLGAPAPALALLGGAPFATDSSFQLVRAGGGLRAEKQYSNGLYVVKEFIPGTNHVLSATVRIENHSGKSLRLAEHELVVGTATPINRHDLGQFLAIGAYDGTRAVYQYQGWFANRTLGCFPGTPRTQYVAESTNIVWTAACNQFFAMIGAPRDPAPEMIGRQVDLPAPTDADRAADPKAVLKPVGYQASLAYPAMVLTNGQSVTHVLDLFAGPKEYNTLAKLGKNQDLAMNFNTMFAWFAKALLLGMNGLHSIGVAYGMAIICITVIIKLLFWPLTQASMRSMKRMQTLQPQMKAIQEKYKDDPKKMNMKVMEFMKENKVNPMGGCLPIMLQIPVFIGFYQMLQTAIKLRGAHFLWACDLSQPDTVYELLGFPINPLPLIMGASQFWQARMTPPSPGVDPMQQKIMQYMPLMLVFFFYNFSSGLALYWTVQNLLSIVQMKLTKAGTGPAGKPSGPHASLPPGRKR